TTSSVRDSSCVVCTPEHETNGTLTLTVNRTGATNTAVTVDFTTTNGTATAGTDYTATNGTLSFAAGQTSKTFTVDILDDDTQESSETFKIVLSNPTDTTLAVATNPGHITVNDISTARVTAHTNHDTQTESST